tara:strand:+ start:905 stop:1153 length:249 start_codon:yes stop_codon:yes gene_type:complete
MDIGSNVYVTYHSILRFGTITGKLKDPDKWTYFTVRWVEDDQYETNVKPSLKKDKYLYRADELTPVDAARLSRVAAMLGGVE